MTTNVMWLGILMAALGCGGGQPAPATATTPPASTTSSSLPAECAGFSEAEAAVCPIGAWGATGADDVEGGAVLHLGKSAPAPELVQKRTICHRAWMASAPANAMPRCPFGVPGLTITAVQGASSVDLKLVTSDAASVDELRKRAHAAVRP
jgi:hypothetical protein